MLSSSDASSNLVNDCTIPNLEGSIINAQTGRNSSSPSPPTTLPSFIGGIHQTQASLGRGELTTGERSLALFNDIPQTSPSLFSNQCFITNANFANSTTSSNDMYEIQCQKNEITKQDESQCGTPYYVDHGGKREIRLSKNRAAARECRRKKKVYVQCLEHRVGTLEQQNQMLIEELNKLRKMNQQLMEEFQSTCQNQTHSTLTYELPPSTQAVMMNHPPPPPLPPLLPSQLNYSYSYCTNNNNNNNNNNHGRSFVTSIESSSP